MNHRSLVVTAVSLFALASFWAVANWLAPSVAMLSGWSMALCCLWAVLLGIILHAAHCRGTKHRGALGGVKFLFALLLVLTIYVIVWQLLSYALRGGAVVLGVALPDLLYYPKLWVNKGLDWFIVLLAGSGGGGILGWLNSYQWQFLPVALTCLATYLASHLVTVCLRRR